MFKQSTGQLFSDVPKAYLKDWIEKHLNLLSAYSQKKGTITTIQWVCSL
jgi:hypothetical protein